jgi:hypothetical protein
MWQQMLHRQVTALEDHPADTNPAAEGDNHPIERMLALLVRFRGVEGEVAGRRLAEPEN